MNTERRKFITTGLAVTAATLASRLIADEVRPPAQTNAAPAERTRPPPQDLALVLRFVQAGHRDLAKVQEMVAQDPKFVLATWDWGQGDWETALGGASHTGRRDIARYLLSQGARIDSFCAAMLGERDVMLALLKADPTVATTKGPHGYTLLYHVAISGDVVVAKAMKPLLATNAKDFDQALSAAARDGHLPMTKWLLQNGVTDPNVPDGFGKTALVFSIEKKFPDIEAELRRHGAREKS
jgi:Ankyrin repeats (many copies)